MIMFGSCIGVMSLVRIIVVRMIIRKEIILWEFMNWFIFILFYGV